VSAGAGSPGAREAAPARLVTLPPVLVYHKIDTGFELGVNVVSPRAFTAQMCWLAARGLRGVSLADALDGRAPRDGSVVLTFDDAYEALRRHALPVLGDLGFRGTLFVPSAFVGRSSAWDTRLLGRRYRHLDRAGLRAFAAAGFEIGSHSATHGDLRRGSDARLAAETAGSRAALEEATAAPVTSFAYPFGRADARVRAAVVRAGYRAACGGGGAGACAGRTEGTCEALAIPRLGVRAVDGLGALRAKLDGGRGERWERMKEAFAHFAAGGTPLARAWFPFLDGGDRRAADAER
jgi:peptidoglycan/xylan/chitin deacetylase (PgdA/CDA1 family)